MSRKIFITLIAIFLLGGLYLLVKPFDSQDYRISNEATIVAFGDSLTAGYGSSKDKDYVTVLSRMINRPIVNLGMSGDTTTGALNRVGEITKRNPELVIIFLGGNDVLRRENLNTTFGNLDEIVKVSSQNGAKVVLVGVPGSVFGDPYEKRFKEIAKKYDAIFIPQFLSKLIGKKDLMYDAIHPNDAGYKIVAEKIYEVVKDLI